MKVESMDAPVVQSVQVKSVPNGHKAEEIPQVAARDMQKHGLEKSEFAALLQKPISELTASEREELPISEKTLIDAIEKANKAAIGRNTSFRFSIHEGTKRISVKVLDADTQEVIREIPPEKILDMVAKMWEFAGLFIDERR